MISLKELHPGDIIYQVWKYHWISKIKIISKFKPFEYQTINNINNNTETYYIKGNSTLNLNSNIFNDSEKLFKDDEDTLYASYKEAKNVFETNINNRINYLKQNNNLIKELYNQTALLSPADKEIYKNLINKCTITFK